MKLNEYYVCDADGNIVEKVKAKTLFNMLNPVFTMALFSIVSLKIL